MPNCIFKRSFPPPPPLFQCTENVDTKDSGLHFRLFAFCGFFQKALSEEWPDDTLPQPTEPSLPLARLLTNMASQEELRRKKKGLLPTSQNSASKESRVRVLDPTDWCNGWLVKRTVTQCAVLFAPSIRDPARSCAVNRGRTVYVYPVTFALRSRSCGTSELVIHFRVQKNNK